MNTPPLTFERRIELLENANRNLADLQSVQDRLPQGTGKRWTYWALTSLPYEGSYPSADGDNTFPIKFVDPVFTPTAGAQTLTTKTHSDFPRTVGRTTNGQWCLPGELVMVSPLPPPFGTTNKGRWLITPLKTYYYGVLNGPLTRLSFASVSVYVQTPAGTWTDTLYDQIVWDADFLEVGESLPTGTWVRFEWEKVSWVVREGHKSSAILAIATLNYPLCGNTALITSFQRLDGSTTAVPPTTANNSLFQHRGLTGDQVLLTYSALHAAWLVIDVTGHDYDIYVGMGRTGQCEEDFCVWGDVVSARLEICSTHIRRTIFCLPPCPPQSSVQTSEEQTSEEQTSTAIQTSSVGCGDGTINPALIQSLGDERNLLIQAGGPSEALTTRLIDITILSQDPCPTGDPAYSTVNPRSNTLFGFGPGYRAVFSYSPSYDAGGPSYKQGLHELYNLSCKPRYDILTTGTSLATGPEDREWYAEGKWGQATSGGGPGYDGEIRVSETQGAAINVIGTGWVTMPGSIEILSLNPFHARMNFDPRGFNNDDYPSFANLTNCGPSEVEWTEV